MMLLGSALLALTTPSIEFMLVASATRTQEPVGPAGLLQSSLPLLLGAVEPLELRQREAFLELNGTERRS